MYKLIIENKQQNFYKEFLFDSLEEAMTNRYHEITLFVIANLDEVSFSILFNIDNSEPSISIYGTTFTIIENKPKQYGLFLENECIFKGSEDQTEFFKQQLIKSLKQDLIVKELK